MSISNVGFLGFEGFFYSPPHDSRVMDRYIGVLATVEKAQKAQKRGTK